ncbi:MAG TPA: site-2 protease family protein, partial [Candidatus Anaerobiospirillum stercoravium]|nr:site-2 protease family protein [Candidatus Anaerobiospirillum stercoravium]
MFCLLASGDGMGGALWNLLFFFIVLGILVTIHEFGHYLAARLCGVKVYRFCLGFGPVIFRKVRANGEEFAIALLPLGGYVKMKGESADVTALQSAGA